MEFLQRNQTTARLAVSIENASFHCLRAGEHHSAAYFKLLDQRRQLPASKRRQDFLNEYQRSQVVLVSGETGSGKTTQIPQFVFYDEVQSGKIVASAQPEPMLAISAARRVAEEMDVPVGEEVGHRVPFDDKTCGKTMLQYTTSDILVRDALDDILFSKYSCIIIDAFNERRLYADILLALLKKAVMRRRDLKVVIIATKFTDDRLYGYFGSVSSLAIGGTAHPVRIQYWPDIEKTYLDLAKRLVIHMNNTMNAGDILVFLPTIDDVLDTQRALLSETNDLYVAVLHPLLPMEELKLVHESSEHRKCILATGIAEHAFKIDGILYVIDSGITQSSGYIPESDMKTMHRAPVSQFAAAERTAQAGRTGPGVCLRLYDEDTYNGFLAYQVPHILSLDITAEVLLLGPLNRSDVGTLEFLDPPQWETYRRATTNLQRMGYFDTTGSLTVKGAKALRFPVDPAWYNALLAGHDLGCSDDIVTLAALACTEHPIFLSSYALPDVVKSAHEPLICTDSDHISELNAVQAAQLKRIAEELFGQPLIIMRTATRSMRDRNVRTALARGFYAHAAFHRREEQTGLYVTAHGNIRAQVLSSSRVHGMNHEWVVYDSLVHTSRAYLQKVTAVEADWLPRLT
ncbi:hypothetical protein S40288_00874 [Stachybotrys chartarum IBT 40288]|nr:hypothetical protein S40288_00874 [Stachybotrys chartarum IBT 40288]